ncbi:Glycosyltransferase family 15 protein [Mycena sanguinolenta]|uniref:Glycosyltransferase family 15 protein n=1 Tax=Mycena sanguinolenta TaxID=230812 RepID=A0A8H6XJJ8_9AGAR|nr:Glycosyltransferase family 15 protein [Mycena sanguinolenta]
MQRRARFVALAFIVSMALLALYRKYSPVLWIDRDPADIFPGAESPAEPAKFVDHAVDSAVTKASPRPQIPLYSESGSSRRANATFVMLARNSDLEGALLSVRGLEDRFNSRYGYPYVFLNEEEFTEDFKRRIRNLTPSRVEFGLIPKEHWYQPDWIDNDKARTAMTRMDRMNVKYGGNLAYHNMCRYNSGFFFKHPLMQQYRWYWRVEPKVKFSCDIQNDPFLFMEDNDKIYGFTLAVYEIPATIPTLWDTVKKFRDKHPEYIRTADNALAFISQDGGRSYNRCHSLTLVHTNQFGATSRSPRSISGVVRLTRRSSNISTLQAGFTTRHDSFSRWGDAPVHSIAASLFLKKSQIHLFEDIGYQHDDWQHCPQTQQLWEAGRCMCSIKDSFDYSPDSCRKKWDMLN